MCGGECYRSGIKQLPLPELHGGVRSGAWLAVFCLRQGDEGEVCLCLGQSRGWSQDVNEPRPWGGLEALGRSSCAEAEEEAWKDLESGRRPAWPGRGRLPLLASRLQGATAGIQAATAPSRAPAYATSVTSACWHIIPWTCQRPLASRSLQTFNVKESSAHAAQLSSLH